MFYIPRIKRIQSSLNSVTWDKFNLKPDFQRRDLNLCLIVIYSPQQTSSLFSQKARRFKLIQNQWIDYIWSISGTLFIIFKMGKTKCHKASWSQQEERVLSLLVKSLGDKNWQKISVLLNKKYGFKKKSNRDCRQRWFDHLCPTIVKKTWSEDQKEILFKCHEQMGNKWSKISEHLPGRSQRDIKNHFYSAIRKSLRKVSKLEGSKDSTHKIKQIKPSILSSIFQIGSTFFQKQMGVFSSLFGVFAKSKVYQLIRLTSNQQKLSLEGENFKILLHLINKISQKNKNYQDEKKMMEAMNKQKKLEKNFDKYINQDFEESEGSSLIQESSFKQAEYIQDCEDNNLGYLKLRNQQNPILSASESTNQQMQFSQSPLEELQLLEISHCNFTRKFSSFDQSVDSLENIEYSVHQGDLPPAENTLVKGQWWLQEPSLNLLVESGCFFF